MNPLYVLVSFSCLTLAAPAQAAGLRGAGEESPIVERLTPPDPDTAERVITIEAVAEVRVVPSRLRVVFAVSAADESATGASRAGRALLAATKSDLLESGVEAANIDVDFIAVVPIYTWQVEKQSGTDVVAEKRVGVRVQYNVHVGVADEAGALAAIEAATASDGVDLLAVDYWSDDLEARQIEAQEKALVAAQQKAKRLLSVFADPPRPINVHENTRMLFPQHLYESLSAAEDSASSWYPFGKMPRVPASRPLQVYYRGLFGDVDAVETTMPGRREIEVVSTVRLYFQSPGRPVGK